MKARNTVFLPFLVLISGLFLSGCGWFGDLVDWAFFNDQIANILKDKYMPTSWIWVVLAFLSTYLFLRTPTSRYYAAVSGMILLFPMAVSIMDKWLTGFAFLIGIVIAAFATAVLAIPIALIKAGSKVAGAMAGKAKDAAKIAGEAAKQLNVAKGIEAEKPLDKAMVLSFLTGGIGTLIWLAVLFGGVLFPEKPPTGWHWFDFILRIIAIGAAVASVIYFITDFNESRWECPNPDCGKTVKDWHQNKPLCTHCGYPNPLVGWQCRHILGRERCGAQNEGSDLRCPECGTPRPRMQKFLDAEDEDYDIDMPDQPPPPDLPPPEEPEINCRNCGNRIPASAEACRHCGTLTLQETPNNEDSTDGWV